MKKMGLLLTLLIALGGCSNKNIKIPEEHIAPKEAGKGDSYIFLDNLNHSNATIKTDENGVKTLKVIMTSEGNDVEEMNLYYSDGTLKKSVMESVGVFRGNEYFISEVEVSSENVEYFFEAIDGQVRYFVGESRGYSPSDIEKYKYVKETTKVESDVPEWSKNALWYGINVDTFNNGDVDNDPIFNEMGPEFYFQSREKDSNGNYKSDLVSKGLWRSVDTLGEFKVSDWNGDYSENEGFENNLEAKYMPGSAKFTRRYGGDLQGIIEKATYLKELGVDVINLSEVFYSYSGHKKDTIDFRHISPDFANLTTNEESEYKLLDTLGKTGENNLSETLSTDTWVLTESDRTMITLIEELHNNEMKVVLDVNLEYVSKRFFALKDLLINGKGSPYKEWFIINGDWDKEYEYKGTSIVGVTLKEDGKSYRKAFVEVPEGSSQEVLEEIYRWNLKHLEIEAKDENQNMIVLNYENEELQNYVINSLGKWLELGVDGYRVEDTGVDKTFVTKVLEELKSNSTDKLFVEAWSESSVGRKEFNSRDNFELGEVILGFVQGEVSKADLESAFYIYSNLSDLEKVYASLIYLDSGETDRVFSMMANSVRNYDSSNTTEEGYLNARPDLIDKKSIEKVKLASTIQLTTIGAPYMYYGTEVGMWGGDEPNNKKPMIWEDETFENEKDDYYVYEEKNMLKLSGIKYNRVRKYVEYPVNQNNKIKNHYDELTKFRTENEELFKKGKLRYLEVIDEVTGLESEDILAYEKINGTERAIVIVNRGNKKVEAGIYTEGRGEYRGLFTDEVKSVSGRRLKVEIGALESNVFYQN